MIFEITHSGRQNNRHGTMTTLVEAVTADEAREFFNKAVESRRNRPYFWSEAQSVRKPTILNAKSTPLGHNMRALTTFAGR